VGFTQGFHPRQKLAFGPPLTLGYTSRAEYLDIQLETPFQQEMIFKVEPSPAVGISDQSGATDFRQSHFTFEFVNTACYEVTLPDSKFVTQEAVESYCRGKR